MTDLMNHNSLVHIRKTEMSAAYESHPTGAGVSLSLCTILPLNTMLRNIFLSLSYFETIFAFLQSHAVVTNYSIKQFLRLLPSNQGKTVSSFSFLFFTFESPSHTHIHK